VQLPHVSRVYTLVRASSSDNAAVRVLQSLHARSIDFPFSHASKIIAVPSRFSREDLGLDESTVRDLHSSLTHVIHSAWAVNFNLGVRSFEDQHIKGLHSLIQFCLSVRTPKPASFYFCSSVSVAAGTNPLPVTIDEAPVERFEQAQRTGYAQSKLVAEHIVVNAARTTSCHAKVLRIGQIVGDSKVGIWNDTEAIPLMIRSAITIGALPALDEVYIISLSISLLLLCSLKCLF
jgi:thioester reductase-like protein